MRRHVDLVGVLFVLWGGMILLLSLSLLSIGFAATAIGAAEDQNATSGKLAAGLVAAGFFTLSAAGFLFGGVHLWLGTRLRAFREWARAFAIVVAVVNLVLIPFGTALGVYSLWALLHHESRMLFHEGAAARTPQV
jgi:hypothetical protein